jgi:ribosomal protein S27E
MGDGILFMGNTSQQKRQQKSAWVSTYSLMRVTTDDKLEAMHPSVPCKKCGKKNWLRATAPLTWSCLGCGNLLYIELGRSLQQIEIIMRSHRGKEYRTTERGTIIPVCTD